MGPNGHNRLLIGKKAITDYLQIGDGMFYEMIRLGMPARAVNKRWMAYPDNLDEFFKVFTRVDNRKGQIPEDAE
jgi:hypothetical protein